MVRAEGVGMDGKTSTGVDWKPNCEKCPVTKVVNGNGIDGLTEGEREG
ncbi:MAG: hypothetical protein HOA16_07275 [Opitutae bacterium]|nr:hypothetical protein [Opitutae bacterium]MBT6850980.1 hypothetical protein [Opitutae bacterium]MBT7742042.1 hypothetical protein [Opitutae bacterium]